MEEIKKPETTGEATASKQTKKGSKIASGILTALLIAVLVFCGVVVVKMKVTKKPFVFGYGVFYVLTGSMEPEIHVGDVIVDKQVDSISDLAVGDIITYHGKEGDFNGKTVTHKIIRIEGDKIVTKGVSTMSIKEDPAITFDDVVGKYVRTSAFLTFIYKVFTNKIGFFAIIFVPLLILLVVQVVNFARACRMKEGKPSEEKSAEELKNEAIKEKEEEIKRKAIEDYLASKKRIEEAEKESRKKAD